jgi:hypothetical protein
LSVGVGENPRESLSELARLGARPIIQRAVEDEFDAWLGRARYERRHELDRKSEEGRLRNGFRPSRKPPWVKRFSASQRFDPVGLRSLRAESGESPHGQPHACGPLRR